MDAACRKTPGTLAALVASYMKSAEYIGLRQTTKAGYISRLEALRTDRDTIHTGAAEPSRELGGHRLGIRLDRHLGRGRQREQEPFEGVPLRQRRGPAAEEDRLDLRCEQLAAELELGQQRVDVGAVQVAVPDDGHEVAVAAP